MDFYSHVLFYPCYNIFYLFKTKPEKEQPVISVMLVQLERLSEFHDSLL